ncbi:MAG TPA: hypothetical protein VIK52_14200 [Opitutaceae bacterium]
MPADRSLPPHLNPMSDAEVRELLSATLHGPLPQVTVQRLLATVARDVEARRAPVRVVSRLREMPNPDECPHEMYHLELVNDAPHYACADCGKPGPRFEE